SLKDQPNRRGCLYFQANLYDRLNAFSPATCPSIHQFRHPRRLSVAPNGGYLGPSSSHAIGLGSSHPNLQSVEHSLCLCVFQLQYGLKHPVFHVHQARKTLLYPHRYGTGEASPHKHARLSPKRENVVQTARIIMSRCAIHPSRHPPRYISCHNVISLRDRKSVV